MKLNTNREISDLIWLRAELYKHYPEGNLMVASISLLSPAVQADVMLMLLFRHRFGFLPIVANPAVAKILDVLFDDFDL